MRSCSCVDKFRRHLRDTTQAPWHALMKLLRWRKSAWVMRIAMMRYLSSWVTRKVCSLDSLTL